MALHAPLVESLVYELWSGATQVASGANADIRTSDVTGAYPPFKV